MRADELAVQFSQSAVERSTNLNALAVAEAHYFGMHRPGSDYRGEALDAMKRAELPFSSTCNSTWEIFKRFVTVKCPYCDNQMEGNGGGGSGGCLTQTYICKCGAGASITLGEGGFCAAPKKKPHRSIAWILSLRDVVRDTTEGQRRIKRGWITVNNMPNWDEHRNVIEGDVVVMAMPGQPEYKFIVTEHDVTGHPDQPGGKFPLETRDT